MSNPRHLLGRRAEDAVAAWLAGRGWRILERRWRAPEGELDLVCLDPGGSLVGIEVRARRGVRSGSALESLDRRRLVRRRRALAACASALAIPATALRVDLVTVEPVGTAWRIVRYPLDAG